MSEQQLFQLDQGGSNHVILYLKRKTFCESISSCYCIQTSQSNLFQILTLIS